jgi:hypothetical protein
MLVLSKAVGKDESLSSMETPRLDHNNRRILYLSQLAGGEQNRIVRDD